MPSPASPLPGPTMTSKGQDGIFDELLWHSEVTLSKSRQHTRNGTETWVGGCPGSDSNRAPPPSPCISAVAQESLYSLVGGGCISKEKGSNQAGQMEVITGGKEEKRRVGRGQQGQREEGRGALACPTEGRSLTRHRFWQHREPWIWSPPLILSNHDPDVFPYLMGLVKTSSISEVEKTGLKSAGLGNTLSPTVCEWCHPGRVIVIFPSLFHLQMDFIYKEVCKR